jgi:hypothetical protein
LDLADLDTSLTARRAPVTAIDQFAAMLDRGPVELRPLIARLLQVPPQEVGEAFERWGAELAYLALQNPDEFDQMIENMAEGRSEAERSEQLSAWARTRASRALRAAISSSG